MLIAQAKRKENIAEYLLYMWQIEDIIRSFGCNMDTIEENIISKFPADNQAEVRDWWEGLVKMIELENKKQSGHLQINKNILLMLTELHLQLLNADKFPEYGAEFYRTLPYIVELRAKSPDNQVGELETCFNALYGTLLLRLRGKEMSEATKQAIAQISKFIATLAAFFKMNEEKPLFEDDEDM